MNEGINLAAICIADGFGVILSTIMLGARVWIKNERSTEAKLLRMMLVTTLISCLADIFVFVFDGKGGSLLFILLYLGNTWLFVSNVLIGTLWVMVLIAHISGDKLPLNQKVLVLVLDIIGTTVLLFNFIFPVVFKIGPDNVYSRGPLFWLYIAIEMIIVLDSFIFYFVYRKKVPETKHFPVWQFLIPVIIGVVVQALVYGVSLICPSLSLAVCGVILGLFSEREEEAEILRQNEMKSRIIIEQQEKLEEALSMAQSANRSKTAFLNNMSHDIRTPMNAIIGYTGLAKTHIDDSKQVIDYLGKIEKSSDYLLSLINEVLDMSRIESGKMTLFEQSENFYEIVSSIKDIIQSDINKKKHEFKLDINVQNERIVCDKLRLKQILINILSNSIKYTPEKGKISMSVTEMQSEKTDSVMYEICINDNGIGMDEEYLKNLFEPFTRVKSSTVSGIQGTGLGMAITKNLIDMMGGRIDVKSKPDNGTAIKVVFEFKKAGDEDGENGKINQESDYKAKDFAGIKVLLVEDNELNREIATKILEENGLIVETAEDGDIAVDRLRMAELGDYDLVLMDIQMPRMDGYEATRRIRALKPLEEHIPIIAMTANAFDEDRKLAIEAGMDDHIPKPISIDNLFKVMAKYV